MNSRNLLFANLFPTHRASAGRPQYGQSLLEFAMVLPLLIFILIIVVQFGLTYYAYVSVTNAAREGARYGMAHPNGSEAIQTRVTQELQGTAIAPVSVEVKCWEQTDPNAETECADAHTGDLIRVTVTYSLVGMVTGSLPFIGTLPFSDPMPLSNYAEMAITNGIVPIP